MDAIKTAKMKMNRNIIVLPAALLLFVQCEKTDLNPDFPFTIVVKTLTDSTRAANAFVEVTTTIPGNEIKIIGSTDVNGEVSFEFDRDAVFLVRASRGKDPITWIGCNFVRLEPNKRVTQTVYMQPFDPKLEGCLEDR